MISKYHCCIIFFVHKRQTRYANFKSLNQRANTIIIIIFYVFRVFLLIKCFMLCESKNNFLYVIKIFIFDKNFSSNHYLLMSIARTKMLNSNSIFELLKYVDNLCTNDFIWVVSYCNKNETIKLYCFVYCQEIKLNVINNIL